MLEQFGPYRLDTLLGRGGMGEVYRAYDEVRKRTVAVKRLSGDLATNAEFRARFRRESELAARLAEPHIIPIHDYGEIDGRLYLDMRLVEGEDLATVVKRAGRLAPERAVHIVGQVARALDAAHAQHLVHRDVKPSNVLVSGPIGDEFAYLIDFGISRPMQGGDSAVLTATGNTIGTFAYMAPERFDNCAPDHLVDVYSLACVLFETLTGSHPFTAQSVPALIHCHLHSEPPPLASRGTDLPASLDDVVRRGMAKNSAERYPSAGELASAARRALSGPPAGTATHPHTWPRSTPRHLTANVRPPAPTPPVAQIAPTAWGVRPAFPVGYASSPPRGMSGSAIAALMMGILGFLVIPLILAFVFGVLALKRIARSGQGGRGLAITGMVLAGIWAVLIVIGFATGSLTVTSDTPSAAPAAPVGAPAVPGTPPPAGGTTPTTGSSSVNAIDLAVGDCVSQMGGPTSDVQLSVVDCAQLHQSEVFAEFTVTATTYPGDDALSKEAEDGCVSRLAGYSPAAVGDPSISISFVYPSAQTWAAGNREVQCLAFSDPATTGSIRR
ncbi:protein kinase domain-containing protein [Pseudonocardia sp.]|uniref:protein kinase domain-containing protein n=1 Tax=Pseudonocardia sp. TaxID=60912 RepID=UPI003D10D025